MLAKLALLIANTQDVSGQLAVSSDTATGLITAEILSAFIDNTLDPALSNLVIQALANDPDLRRQWLLAALRKA